MSDIFAHDIFRKFDIVYRDIFRTTLVAIHYVHFKCFENKENTHKNKKNLNLKYNFTWLHPEMI